MAKTDYCVFIGRFQPFHNGHMDVVKDALNNVADKLLIVIGSHRTSKTLSNPWTFEEREQMIMETIPSKYHDRVKCLPARDYLYSEVTWLTGVQSVVANEVFYGATISLIGHYKDATSYYLKLFPQWDFIESQNYSKINATQVRNEMWTTGGFNPCLISVAVAKRLIEYIKTPAYTAMVKEYKFLKEYKKSWEAAPYPPTFVTTDAVIVQAGHVLMVKRKFNPGKGMYALPGGFVNQDETILNSCLREVKEETNILFPRKELAKALTGTHVFDHPKRDKRGRTITHAHYFNIKDVGPLPQVKGGDDAESAVWLALSNLPLIEDNIYADHIHIINYFVSNIG